MIAPTESPAPRRWVVTTTLNNNLLSAKLPPLLAAIPSLEIVLVTDSEGAPIPRVHYRVPKGWKRKVFGRLGSRWLMLFAVCSDRAVERVMVYNAVPHLLLAFLPAKLFGKPLDLHLIAGQLDLDFANRPQVMVNRVIRRLRNPVLLEKLFRWMAFRHCQRFFVPGQRARAWLIEQGIPAQRIHLIHSTVDCDVYRPAESPRDLDVLVISNLQVRKRPELTVRILEQILAARPGTRFAWIGDGHLRHEVQQMVAASPIRNACVMVGRTDDVLPYQKRAKVFLLNSLSEGLSLACMEAMACGCVPVSADVGDMAEVVRNDQTGALIPAEAGADVYSRSILDFLNNEEIRARFAAAGRELIKNEHSHQSAVEAWGVLGAGLRSED